MPEEVLESEAFEEPEAGSGPAQETRARPLPQPAEPGGGALAIWRDDVKAAALVAGAGIVAGAATVAAVRATRALGPRRRSGRGLLLRRDPPQRVVASRSFLVDVHVLGSK